MRCGELAGVTLKVVILGDEGSARRPCIGEYICVGACTQADIIGVFCLKAFVAQVGGEARWQVLIHQKAPT